MEHLAIGPDYDLRIGTEAQGMPNRIVGSVAEPIDTRTEYALGLDDMRQSLVERGGLNIAIQLRMGQRFVHIEELHICMAAVVRVDRFDLGIAAMENRAGEAS